jgi:PAS domain S-box-containing protein
MLSQFAPRPMPDVNTIGRSFADAVDAASLAPAEESFRQFLVRLSAVTADASDAISLIRLFCSASCDFFGVAAACYWKLEGDQLVATEAQGCVPSNFVGTRVPLGSGTVTAQAVCNRKTTYQNRMDLRAYPFASEATGCALMAAPVSAGDEVGALVFVHETEAEYFTDDLAEKATVLAGALGNAMETTRLTRQSRAERQCAVLIQCAEVLSAHVDAATLTRQFAEHVRKLMDGALAAVVLRQRGRIVLQGVSAATPELAQAIRAQNGDGSFCLCDELAQPALSSPKPLIITASAESGCGPRLKGEVLVAPLRTTGGEGAIVIYCGPEHRFCEEDVYLVGAVARFGALAISNAELYATANERARELQQLLDISSELRSIGDLDKFLERFVVRAAEFLGFARSFLALMDGTKCQVRWVAEKGVARPLDLIVPDAIARVIKQREPTWSDDVTQELTDGEAIVRMFASRQYLAVPLLGTDQRALGLLCVLQRDKAGPIHPEDVRRAEALAAEIAVVLEATRNLYLAQQHCRRAEDLTAVALELNSSLRLPEFASNFSERAAEMLGAKAAVLAVSHGATLDTVVFHSPAAGSRDRELQRRLNLALTAVGMQTTESVHVTSAPEALGAELAATLSWRTLTFARLTGGNGDLVGLLCLADIPREPSGADRKLLQALAAHASVALENARLFTRMDQANRHWMEIFDSITDFIVVHDQNNNVLRVNRTLADFIGLRPAQLIGIGMRALMSLAADSSGLQPCPFCRAGGNGVEVYVHPVLQRTYLVSTSRIHGELNEGLQAIHVLKDITDRREAERRYRELFDNIQEGLFFSSPDGRFVEVNDALVRMLGYTSREELLQVDIPTQLYLAPEARQKFEAAILNSGGVLRNFEEVLRRKDGSLIHTLQNAFAVKDMQGRVVQYRGLMLDITELKNFQAELQRERDFSSKILNNTQSLILVVDTAGLISYANRRCYEAGNYTEADLVGRRLLDLVSEQRRGVLARSVDLCLLGQQVDNLEVPIQLGGGRTGQFSINLSPMRDEQGAVNSLVVVMTDITDAAMLQAKLMHTEKMAAVGQLVSGVAHEVNNPLTAVLGFADLLLEKPEIPESARKDLAIILQEAQRTKQIVQNLLSFARQMPPQRAEVPVNAILRRTLALRSYDLANRDVKVIERFDPNLPDVVGDSHQLQQVFLNILNNAYDAVCETDRAGEIVIETRLRNGCAEIEFRDNGPGIRHPDRIFDPFFTTKEVGKGTGLGLSICYGIVHEHGGEIACGNNTSGPGATFIVRLPSGGKALAARSGRDA